MTVETSDCHVELERGTARRDDGALTRSECVVAIVERPAFVDGNTIDQKLRVETVVTKQNMCVHPHTPVFS